MVTSRAVHLIERPNGAPEQRHFETVESELPPLEDGQVLVRNDWMSVDPAMRGRMRDVPSYVPPFQLGEPMQGGAVGTVVESRVEGVEPGAVVQHYLGWRDLVVLDKGDFRAVDTSLGRPSDFLGVLGMTGLTAYVGLTEIAPVKEGDTVFISGAAGAVGLVAARVARHLGATTVIGSAGGPEKVARLTEEFGYDVGLDYKAEPIGRQLRAAAPDGIDVYFDNVGGDHLQAAISSLTTFGKVAACGAISGYNDEKPAPGPTNLMMIVSKRLSVRGFIVIDHWDAMGAWQQLAAGWLADGSIPTPQTVYEGLDRSVDALIDLLAGANTGKMLVKLT